MTNPSRLQHPQEVIGKYWKKDQSPEQARALSLARDALLFVSATGQRYLFEDFRKGLPSRHSPLPLEVHPTGLANLQEDLSGTALLFLKLQDATHSAREKELIQIILDTLHFISSTGQYSPLRDFLEHVESKAPPYVVASFDSREEAEAWLKAQSSPERRAWVLAGNEIHLAAYYPNINHRALFPLSMAKGHESEPEPPRYH